MERKCDFCEESINEGESAVRIKDKVYHYDCHKFVNLIELFPERVKKFLKEI
jgi:hypothetical protein